jgi:hypothetical protein
VLSKSLCQTYINKPKDSIEYFAKSLLSQAKMKRGYQAVRRSLSYIMEYIVKGKRKIGARA